MDRSRPGTASEENAQKAYAERQAPFKATHTYKPNGWDSDDPRGVIGEPIEPESKVELMKHHTKSLHRGMPPEAKKMFNVVRDEKGNRQNVSMSSLFHDRRSQ